MWNPSDGTEFVTKGTVNVNTNPNSNRIRKMVLAAMFLALALVLPLLTGQLKQLGNALCPMHIPVLLCGFFCGPMYGLAIGFVAPLLRFLIFSMPPLMPTGLAMAFELAVYGFMAGLMFKVLPKKKPFVYVALAVAMLSGRIVWGIAMSILAGLGKTTFGPAAFAAGAFVNAVPGIAIQIVLVPVIVMLLKKYEDE